MCMLPEIRGSRVWREVKWVTVGCPCVHSQGDAHWDAGKISQAELSRLSNNIAIKMKKNFFFRLRKG